MRSTLAFITALTFGLSVSAEEAPASEEQLVQELIDAGMTGIRCGELASVNGSTPIVREFGQRLIDLYTKMNTQLKEVASTNGSDLAPVLSKDPGTRCSELELLTGRDFDQAFQQKILRNNERTLKGLQFVSRLDAEPQLKAISSQIVSDISSNQRQAYYLPLDRSTARARLSREP